MADYLLALKRNHGTFHGEVHDLFTGETPRYMPPVGGGMVVFPASSFDKGHRRVEERHLTVTYHPSWHDGKERRSWLNLCSLLHLRSARHLPAGSRGGPRT